jgi:hypothetical protein
MRTGILPVAATVFEARDFGTVLVTFGRFDVAFGFGLPVGMMNHTAPSSLANSVGRIEESDDGLNNGLCHPGLLITARSCLCVIVGSNRSDSPFHAGVTHDSGLTISASILENDGELRI